MSKNFKITLFIADEEAAALMDDDNMEVDQDENIASPDPTMTASQQTTKKSLKLSYEEYKAMAIMIVHYLKKKESEDKEKDITKKDVVAWYIEEVSNDIESQVMYFRFWKFTAPIMFLKFWTITPILPLKSLSFV